MPEIKAIETRYNGHRFRSRLEAKWAVAFDALGIKYLYELEGFKMAGGLCYLPDFYLPDMDIYVELKPARDIAWSDFRKMAAFSGNGGFPLLLIIGYPGKHELHILDRASFYDLSSIDGMIEGEKAGEQGSKDNLWASLDAEGRVGFMAGPEYPCKWRIVRVEPPDWAAGHLSAALAKGCTARFEHGECG